MKTAPPPPEVEEPLPLVFQWERRSRAYWRLGALVGFSLLIHAIGFYVLQVAYTPTGSQLPPPVQVMMARPERPNDPPEVLAQAHALAHWLTVIDPSLTTQPTTPDSDRSAGSFVQYVPSYKAAPAPFKPLDPAATGSAPPPRPRPPGPAPIVGTDNAVSAAGTPSPPTHVRLTGEIASLAPAPLPSVAFALPSGTKTLEPTIFLVGVRPDGGEPFLFREASSGEVSADDFARDYLKRLPFQSPAAMGDGTRWGRAHFDWGRDVYR